MNKWLLVILFFILNSGLSRFVIANSEVDSEVDHEVNLHWWSGVTMTPGVGLRHLGLDVNRKSDGYQANISQALAAKLFFSFSINSPEYNFGHPHIGISLRTYSSVVTLDHQFYDEQTVNSSNGTNSGERIDVGTEVTGYYSYIVPTLHWKAETPAGDYFKAALGVGIWNAKFTGDVAFTANNQPDRFTPRSKITLETKGQLAYLFFMSYETKSGWLYEMTVGGPTFEDSEYEYKVEEVSLIVGRTFTL